MNQKISKKTLTALMPDFSGVSNSGLEAMSPLEYISALSGMLYKNGVALEMCIKADRYREEPYLCGDAALSAVRSVDECAEIEDIRNYFDDTQFRMLSIAHGMRHMTRRLAELTGREMPLDWVR